MSDVRGSITTTTITSNTDSKSHLKNVKIKKEPIAEDFSNDLIKCKQTTVDYINGAAVKKENNELADVDENIVVG